MTASASGILRIAILWKRNRIRTAAARWFGHFAVLCLITFAMLLGGCVSGPALVNHAFAFNAPTDSPGYEILAYRYGDGRGVARSSDVPIRQFGRSNQWTGINGPMPLGDNLYVKWRNKSTDQIFEKTIDLRPLLPKGMTRKEVYFVVAEGDVFVYLVDPLPRPKDWPVVGPKKFQYEKVRQIHP